MTFHLASRWASLPGRSSLSLSLRFFQISPGVCLRQYSLDRLHQRARRFDAEFHSHPRGRSLRLIDKVDVQRMFKRGIKGMIVGDIGLAHGEPPRGPFPAALDADLLDNHGTHGKLPLFLIVFLIVTLPDCAFPG